MWVYIRPFFVFLVLFKIVLHDADGVHRDPTNPSQPVGYLGRTWGSGQGRGKMQEGQVPTSFLPPIWARCFWRPDFLLIPKFYLVPRLSSLLSLLLLSQKVNTHAIPSMPGVTEAPKALVTAMAWWYTPVGQPQCRWTLVSQMAENEREPTMFWSKKSCCGLYSIICILCLIWSKESTKKTRDWQESIWVPNFFMWANLPSQISRVLLRVGLRIENLVTATVFLIWNLQMPTPPWWVLLLLLVVDVLKIANPSMVILPII